METDSSINNCSSSSSSSSSSSEEKQTPKQDVTEIEEIKFVYDDADSFANEISEWYSYAEESEVRMNLVIFTDAMERYGVKCGWSDLGTGEKKSVTMKLLDELDVSDRSKRLRAVRCLIYVAQGCWNDLRDEEEQLRCSRDNVMLLYEQGVFSAVIDLLNMEIVYVTDIKMKIIDANGLRIILTLMYIIIEVMRTESFDENTRYRKQIDDMLDELKNPDSGELLVVTLFNILTTFCIKFNLNYPVKKLTLLIWKLILFTLGGSPTLKELKKTYRTEAGLAVFEDDTLEVVKKMKPSAVSDEGTLSNRNTIQKQRRKLSLSQILENDSSKKDMDPLDSLDVAEMLITSGSDVSPSESAFRAAIPASGCFFWKTKVTQTEIDEYLAKSRLKYFGMQLPVDRNTVVGFPKPVLESLMVLERYKYRPLSEVQFEREINIQRNPMLHGDEDYPVTASEILYRAIIGQLPQYLMTLLSLLNNAAICKSYYGFFDAGADPKKLNKSQASHLHIDIERHHEIIVKAISAILILLLKHFKLNHICQFEFVSRLLILASCDLFIIGFFKKDIYEFVTSRNQIPNRRFPFDFAGSADANCSWRNMFTCVNLLRVLNKLTKNKPSRIMSLVLYKSVKMLKRTLKVRNALMQLYVLKLLKMQTRYLGRRWRKTNMDIITEIYTKVRHRLNEEWAYGDDLKPYVEISQREDFINACVDRFNERRYKNHGRRDFQKTDDDLERALSAEVELTDDFKLNYERWLQQEVFDSNINWDLLLTN